MLKVKRCEVCTKERSVMRFKPNTSTICIYCVITENRKRECTKCSKTRHVKHFASANTKVCSYCKNNTTPEKQAYLQYKREFKKRRNLPFELTQEEYYDIRSQDCTYCGGPGGSIDRVDSSLGYTLDNCTPTCKRCNMMKHTMRQEDFIAHCRKIVEYQPNR